MNTLTTILLLASTTDAFAPPPSSSRTASTTTSTTAINHIDTRKKIDPQELGIWPTSCRDDVGNYVPCDAISGHDRRAMWETYAPIHGAPTSYGAIGCPGGGDWCYASSYGAAAPIPESFDAKKKAATVAAALAGLGAGVGGATHDVGISIKFGGAGALPAATASSSASGGGSVMGEDVRDARVSYAPYTHDGRVGSLGEIGAEGYSEEPQAAQLALPVRRQAGPQSSYAIGSWKK